MSETGNGFSLGLGLARIVTDLERRLGRVSCSGSVVEMGCLSFPTRLNRWVLLIFVAVKCEGSKVELLNDETMLTSGGFWRGLVHRWYLISYSSSIFFILFL